MNSVPLGIGNPDDPLYGILDQEQNFFYMVTCHRPIAEQATALVAQHRPVKLEIISNAVNWYHTLLDNTVCINWGIDHNPEKICVSREITHTNETVQLVKNLLEFLSVKEKIHNFRCDLEKFCNRRIGMALPAQSLRDQFADDAWFNLATAKETANYQRVYNVSSQHLDNIESVFDLPIGLSDYSAQIAKNMAQLPVDQKFKKIFYEF